MKYLVVKNEVLVMMRFGDFS